MLKDMAIINKRLRLVLERLVGPNTWSPRIPFRVGMWSVPANSDGTAAEPVGIDVAASVDYSPIRPGTPWGAPWATTWFMVDAVVPPELDGLTVDAVLDIGFSGVGPGFQAEGMVWHQDVAGDWKPLRGLHPMNHTFRLSDSATTGETFRFLIEAASNPTLVIEEPNPNSDLHTAGREPIYTLGNCDLAVRNSELYELAADYRCVVGWMNELPADQPRANDLATALETSMDALDPLDLVGSATRARAALAGVLSQPAPSSAHRISAIGHAHIDSAWLWPLRETVRKCARTFSNVLSLMETHPEFRFGCSQAVQYEWMRIHYPSIFEGIRAAVERGQWIPIGGSWVEADGNITGGESHLRQLIHGQSYFREHFGVTCTEIWIPDVFGYPASLPQLFRMGGAERFLTQKLSWNRTNAFPHHTFWWEGIDGSRVYTHFPPVDTYNANFSPRELAHAVRNFRDHGRTNRSLMPFGHGDGGGGPSPDMLDQYHRSKNLDGAPRIVIESPADFFDDAIAQDPDPPVWVGELYLEMHRGTYTSQARTKIGNRRAEIALREAELWSTLAFGGDPGAGYPLSELDSLWKTVLLHQFHDILPGSSIGWVHREAEATYAGVLDRLESLVAQALTKVTGTDSPTGHRAVANASPFDRDEVMVIDPRDDSDGGAGDAGDGTPTGPTAVRVRVPAMGVVALEPLDPEIPVQVTTDKGDDIVLDNGIIRARITADGSVRSLVEIASGRESIAPGTVANLWQIHHDMPTEYDAWEIEDYYRNRVEDLPAASSVTVDTDDPLIARVRVTRSFRSSTLVETLELRAGSPRLDVHVDLDWYERNHLLKVAWPLDVSMTEVTREIPYGHLTTPIHTNTSWDVARFEVPAQRWIHLAEGDFGFTLLNDGRYGHDITRTRTADGSPSTTIRLTVVKGAEYPDPNADVGRHRFTYSVMPRTDADRNGTLRTIMSEAYALNTPLRIATIGDTSRPITPVVSTTDDVIVEVVKAAEDGSGDVVLRVWEPYGNRTTAQLELSIPVTDARLTNALEDGSPPEPTPELTISGPRQIHLSLKPFQIATIRLCR